MGHATLPVLGSPCLEFLSCAQLAHRGRQRGHDQSDLGAHGGLHHLGRMGGFYDHVPPPRFDEIGMGIRVPMLVISPYANRGQIDHEVGEFSSPLKFIQSNWGLEHHTERIRLTHDFAHAFDFGQQPRPPDPRAPKQDAIGDPFVYPGSDPSWPEQFRKD